jgi:hypothetical protein
MKDQNRLLEYLWNNQEETLGMNFFSDTFIGPNKIRREGIFEIENDEEFKAIEFTAVITLVRLVPKRKSKPISSVRSPRGKSEAA